MITTTSSYTSLDGIQIGAHVTPEFLAVLTPEALSFVALLEREFRQTRIALLQRRTERQYEIDNRVFPDFLESTASIRSKAWHIAPIPNDLKDRRVEITGPPERKMIINAMNSGANVYMADFEDATSPTWYNIINGQINLMDTTKGIISFESTEGKRYHLQDIRATLMVRPRGWHLSEKHVLIDDVPISASLFDFGLFFFHNARNLVERGSGPYFYLPKLESYLEARLWNDVFTMAEEYLEIPSGTIKATVLIETIPAAFEMDEILYELRDHSAGLNCGRWDYIFSFIKKFRKHDEFILPDRSQLTMTQHFLRSYSRLLIQTCHKRGAHAMGGMAAEIPLRGTDHFRRSSTIQMVRNDKEREVRDGHDGTWVAHPALVGVARSVFDTYMPTSNQIGNLRNDVKITRDDLLSIPSGRITEDGIAINIDVSIQYFESWLRGIGCVPLANKMEDAATAEISRAQLWQWLHHRPITLPDGSTFTKKLYQEFALERLHRMMADRLTNPLHVNTYCIAAKLVNASVLWNEFTEFLTETAYNKLS